MRSDNDALHRRAVAIITVTYKNKLEATYHKFQRRILSITWKDKVKNEEQWKYNHLFEIWEITAQCDAWFSALYKYSYLLTKTKTATACATDAGNKNSSPSCMLGVKKTRPNKSWLDTIKPNIRVMKLRRQEAEILAPDNGELMHQHVWPNVTKAEPMPRTYLSTRFLHGVCMLRECIYGECAHEQQVGDSHHHCCTE